MSGKIIYYSPTLYLIDHLLISLKTNLTKKKKEYTLLQLTSREKKVLFHQEKGTFVEASLKQDEAD